MATSKRGDGRQDNRRTQTAQTGKTASEVGGNSGNRQSGDNSTRGFASMDPERQREIAAQGGRAAHQKGTAHEFTSEEARRAGSMSHKNSQASQQSGGQANQQSASQTSQSASQASQQSGSQANQQGQQSPAPRHGDKL